MSLVGIYGDGSLNELEAMASMMPHRGTKLTAWSPTDRVYLGELRHASCTRPIIEQLALDIDATIQLEISHDGSIPRALPPNHPNEFLSQLESEGLENTLQRLNSYFALAYWDEDKHRLVLACDRMFYKGLYWINLGTRIAFASEYKAFLGLSDCTAKPNQTAIQHYLRSKTAHKSLCMLEGVRSLGPSRLLEITPGKVDLRDYWSPRLALVRRSLQENADILSEGLKKTVASQSRAHNTIGFTLSGGIDSTVLLALAKKTRPEATICKRQYLGVLPPLNVMG